MGGQLGSVQRALDVDVDDGQIRFGRLLVRVWLLEDFIRAMNPGVGYHVGDAAVWGEGDCVFKQSDLVIPVARIAGDKYRP